MYEVLAGAKTQARQTAPKKEVILSKSHFKFSTNTLVGIAIIVSRGVLHAVECDVDSLVYYDLKKG